MRKGFNFYSSYDDVLMALDDKQFVIFAKALLDVQFFRKHIDEVNFKDNLLDIVWKSLKHSIYSQIHGYCSKKGLEYSTLFSTPTEGGAVGGVSTPAVQEEGQEKGQEQGGENAPLRSASSPEAHPTPNEVFEVLWSEHRQFLKRKLNRTSIGDKQKTKKIFRKMWDTVKSKYDIENEQLADFLDTVMADTRKPTKSGECFPPNMIKIITTENILDEIKDIDE